MTSTEILRLKTKMFLSLSKIKTMLLTLLTHLIIISFVQNPIFVSSMKASNKVKTFEVISVKFSNRSNVFLSNSFSQPKSFNRFNICSLIENLLDLLQSCSSSPLMQSSCLSHRLTRATQWSPQLNSLSRHPKHHSRHHEQHGANGNAPQHSTLSASPTSQQ